MKQFKIYWEDLTAKKQAELTASKLTIHSGVLAIIEIEDADITPTDYEGPTAVVELFYRDGANYKYTENFTIPRNRLESVIAYRGDAFYDQDEALISYDHDLGISREDFHGTLGTTYNPDYDHNFVIVQEVDGKPNVDPRIIDEDDDVEDLRELIKATSSHGHFFFDASTGAVVILDLSNSFGPMPHIVDTAEWNKYYPEESMPKQIDILDLGYMDVNGKYEPAEASWRLERKQLIASGE